MRRNDTGRVLALLALLLPVALSCAGDRQPGIERVRAQQVTRVRTDRTYFRDELGRYVFFHGVNVSGSVKTPFTFDEDGNREWPPDQVDLEGAPFTYVDRTMPIEEADEWFGRLHDLGFNAVRLIVIWEGIEPDERGVYDEEYLDYYEGLVAAAERNHVYVLVDMHQDMWSRHLFVRYNEHPRESLAEAGYEPDDTGAMLAALVPPYTNSLRGDGAPRWVIEACLPHKDLDSPHWGDPQILGQVDLETIEGVATLLGSLGVGGAGGGVPPWATYVMSRLPEPYEVNESASMLPWSFWGIAQALSVDLGACVAAFMAGRDVFPDREIDGQNVQDYLQEAYAGAWVQVARRVAGYPNVIGYDLMNEPNGAFIAFDAAVLIALTGTADGVEGMLTDVAGPELGPSLAAVLRGLQLIPMDASPETLRAWGLDDANLAAALGLNYGFDRNYLQPMYGRVAEAIQREDPEAIIWIEQTTTVQSLLSPGATEGQFEINMTWPQGVEQLVFAPHWYPDIYQYIGLNQPPRDFDVEEIRYRDYSGSLANAMTRARYSLGNVPVVFGEFGTYFNYGGIEASRASDYAVSSHILDNYYENFEAMFQSNILWCFSPDNDYEQGDWWNHEDFSIIDPEGNPRSELAFHRPYARALSGKPRATHFYSDFHYFDPDMGTTLPRHEFYVEFDTRETDAPTEIHVPDVQYPDGFYVWVSDGEALFDHEDQTLYYFPVVDTPGHVHWVRLRPPLEGGENEGWRYFFRGGEMVNGQ